MGFWTFSAAGVVGIGLGAVGFGATFWQARKAADAATAAQAATRDTFVRVRRRPTAADLRDLQGAFADLQDALRIRSPQTVLIPLRSSRELVHHLRARPEFDTEDLAASIQSMVAMLADIQLVVDERYPQRPTRRVVVRLLQETSVWSDVLTGWSDIIQFSEELT